jgi:hypothetical protein
MNMKNHPKNEIESQRGLIEKELLKDPEMASVVLAVQTKREQKEGQKEIIKQIKEVIKTTNEHIGKLHDDNILQSKALIQELGEQFADLASIFEDIKSNSNSNNEVRMGELMAIRDEIKQLVNKKVPAPIVNVKTPDVIVPLPKIIDKSTIVQETFHAEKQVELLKQLMKAIDKQINELPKITQKTTIENNKPEQAIPVALVDPRTGKWLDFDKFKGGSTAIIASSSGDSSVPQSYSLLLDEASAYITYVGEADPSSLTSEALWRIKRLDETTGLNVLWAEGNAFFNKVWDNRASYSYS